MSKKIKLPKPGQLVYVEMDDIQHRSRGWRDFAVIAKDKPDTFRSVGWVVAANRRTLILAATTDSLEADAAGFCSFQIPMPSVTRIDKLK
jgi:hypothetical protein